MEQVTQIDAYQKELFRAVARNNHVVEHDIYTHGDGDKIVVIIQELPGIGQETLALADRFIAQGYRVVLPHLFGKIGKTAALSNLVRVFCMRKEFHLFAKNKSSPIVDFLSSLCSMLKERYQVKGVGVIGMCLTGSFAISLMANDAVLAGYASQPSLPAFSQRGLHMSPEEVSLVTVKLDKVGPMHCGRFEKDIFCKAAKFESIANTFNTGGKQRIIFHELKGKGHAILTLDFDKETHEPQKLLREIIAYFDRQLLEL